MSPAVLLSSPSTAPSSSSSSSSLYVWSALDLMWEGGSSLDEGELQFIVPLSPVFELVLAVLLDPSVVLDLLLDIHLIIPSALFVLPRSLW